MSLDVRKTTDLYVRDYLTALGCPRALTVLMLYEAREHDQLLDLDFDPFAYNELTKARSALAATKFLSKATFLSSSYDKKGRAMHKFFEAEALCRQTNTNLRASRFKNIVTGAILNRMVSKIAKILGKFDIEEVVESSGWGPGATTLIPRRLATSPKKFDVERQITPEAYDLVKDWFHVAYPSWVFTFEIVHNNKVVTVPKNSKTDRTIAIEPGMNLWFQKGIGKSLRRRLRNNGIDLNSQVHNQERSRLGSRSNQIATLDFSSASDTISSELVEQLLPREWFLVLDSFRSKHGLAGGKKISYQKFSSMGNGYTFELETLIFYALAVACCDHLGIETSGISVYGDDVALPTPAVDLFSKVAGDIGFVINKSKSYSSSYFRESCGEYHWNGIRIKPMFQKEQLSGIPEILLAVNNVRRTAHVWASQLGCDRSFYRCWRRLSDILGKDFPRISEGFGEVGIIENLDHPLSHKSKAPFGIEGFYVRVYSTLAAQREFSSKGLLLHRLKQIGSQLDVCGRNSIPIPGRTRIVRTRLYVPRWINLGAWF